MRDGDDRVWRGWRASGGSEAGRGVTLDFYWVDEIKIIYMKARNFTLLLGWLLVVAAGLTPTTDIRLFPNT
jgi:hypothetical protein